MSQNLPARRTGAALTPREMSIARRQANIAREERRRQDKIQAKLGPASSPVIPGECEVMGDHRMRARDGYRGESAFVRGYWWVRDNWQTTGPWFMGGGLFTGGTVGFLSDAVTPLHAGLVGGAASAAAALHAHRKLPGQANAANRLWVKVAAAASTGWLALASQIGPMHTATLVTLSAGGAVGAWKWYRFHNQAVEEFVAELVEDAPEPEPEPEPSPAEVLLEYWEDQWIRVADKLTPAKGSRVVQVTQLAPGHVILRVKLVPITQHATTFAGNTAIAQGLETGLLVDNKHLPPGAIKLVADKRDSTMVDVHVRVDNPLAKVITYEDARKHMPRTITKPMCMGMREDGSWDLASLLGNRVMIGADSGGGKSNHMSTFMANLSRMEDVVIWAADMKGGRAMAPWLPRIDWLATSLDEVDLQLRSLEAIIEYRHTVDRTSSKVRVRREMPALVYIMDELAEITGVRSARGLEFANRLESINSLCRALGIHLIVATQYCSLDAFQSPTFRAQFNVNYLLKTKDPQIGQFVIGKDAWGRINIEELTVPGMYVRRDGTTDPIMARTPFMTPFDADGEESNALCTKLAREGARTAPPLDPGSADACVPEYRWRRERLPQDIVREFLEGGTSMAPVPLPGGFPDRVGYCA